MSKRVWQIHKSMLEELDPVIEFNENGKKVKYELEKKGTVSDSRGFVDVVYRKIEEEGKSVTE